MCTQCVSNHAWSVQHQQKLPYYYPSNHKGSVRMAPLDEKSSRRVITIEYLGKTQSSNATAIYLLLDNTVLHPNAVHIQVCYGPNHLLHSCFLSGIKVILQVKLGSSSNWIHLWNTNVLSFYFLHLENWYDIFRPVDDLAHIQKKSKRVIRYE